MLSSSTRKERVMGGNPFPFSFFLSHAMGYGLLGLSSYLRDLAAR